MRLVIGDKNYSSWSMRAWLALKQTGAPFEELVVPLAPPGTRTAALAAHSPVGRVPVLHHDGLVVWETWAIGEYLAELFPDAHLLPSGREERETRARVRSVSLEMATGFAALRTECPMNLRRRVDGAVTRARLSAAAQADVARVVAIWSECRGPFLFGAFTLADAMYAPVVMRFRTYGILPEEPRARAYAEAVVAHPHVAAWDADARRETHAIEAYDRV